MQEIAVAVSTVSILASLVAIYVTLYVKSAVGPALVAIKNNAKDINKLESGEELQWKAIRRNSESVAGLKGQYEQFEKDRTVDPSHDKDKRH